MADEPKRDESDAQGGEKKEVRRGTGKRFFRENPAFGLTLLYVYVTAIGMLYSGILYGEFEINILDYSEVGDFLLAAFKTPQVLLSVGIQAVVVLMVWVYLKARERQKLKRETDVPTGTARTGEATWTDPRLILAILVTVGVFSLWFTYNYAKGLASSIKDGETTTVDVRYRSFKGSAGQVTVHDLAFIGATQKAAFFYDAEGDKRTIVIPQAQLVSIEVPE